ncbi:response regulator [Streptomyces sp. NPDC021749]|uniref:response regulator transcription factor n=1 Tax=Streptomyces sp. NPDC021749 TaxID=3154905 RepID=UPI003402D980
MTTPAAGTPAPSRLTRILLADDQADVRSGFRLILDSQPDMTVVGEAADGATAVDLAHELRPDLVIADIRMPVLDGLEVTRRLTGPATPDGPRVLVVTTFDHDDYVRTALRDGACGTNAGIAARLYISAGTAKTHLANIQAKLKVRNRVGIAAWAWESRHLPFAGP